MLRNEEVLNAMEEWSDNLSAQLQDIVTTAKRRYEEAVDTALFDSGYGAYHRLLLEDEGSRTLIEGYSKMSREEALDAFDAGRLVCADKIRKDNPFSDDDIPGVPELRDQISAWEQFLAHLSTTTNPASCSLSEMMVCKEPDIGSDANPETDGQLSLDIGQEGDMAVMVVRDIPEDSEVTVELSPSTVQTIQGIIRDNIYSKG